MNEDKTFSPKALKENGGLERFTVLSGNYFKIAQELRRKSRTNEIGMQGYHYVFPSVILYVSALEAFFSEYLALALFSNRNNGELIKLKSQQPPYNEFKSWLKKIFSIFNTDLDTGGELFQNVIALKELRNSAAHYNPYFINHTHWPKRLEQVLNKSKVEVINSGWVSNLSNTIIADWAYETIKEAINEFCKISGWENPFQACYPAGWESVPP